MPKKQSTTQIFISHAHEDEILATRLIELLRVAFEVPEKSILCSSVEGYQLPIGQPVGRALKNELASARLVLALFTPNSLSSPWVMHEMGGVWASDKENIPLFAGGIDENSLPSPVRSDLNLGGSLSDAQFVHRLLGHIEIRCEWTKSKYPPYPGLSDDDVRQNHVWAAIDAIADEIHGSLGTNFTAKLSSIGTSQFKILEHVKSAGAPLGQKQLEEFAKDKNIDTHVYYRLEVLRLMGFLKRTYDRHRGPVPSYSWELSERYKKTLSE